jgi:hypothetical protein
MSRIQSLYNDFEAETIDTVKKKAVDTMLSDYDNGSGVTVSTSKDGLVEYWPLFDPEQMGVDEEGNPYNPIISLDELAFILRDIGGSIVKVVNGKYRVMWELYRGW